MKNLLSLLIVLLGLNSLAQENWMYIQTGSSSENYYPVETIPVTNSNNENVLIVIRENKKAKSFLINDKKEVLAEISIDKLPKKASIFSGSCISQNRYKLFFSNQTKKLFGSVIVNFGNNTATVNDEELFLKNEKVIESFNTDNAFYVLTVERTTSKLKLYTFDADGQRSDKTIDLTDQKIPLKNDNKISLKSELFDTYYFNKTKKIEFGEPSSLDYASAENKLYFKDNILTLTFDNNKRYTYIIKIDVRTGDYTFDSLMHDDFGEEDYGESSNTFIYNDYIFTAQTSRSSIRFAIYDFKSKKRIKEYSASKHEPIPFKNTAIIQEGGLYDSYRELEKTAQFIRKINGSNLGLAVFKENDKFVVTIGSTKEIQSGSGMIPIGGGIHGHAFGDSYGGPIFTHFSSYSRSKSTQVKCVFDLNFDHVKGEVPQNGFDKINAFTKDFKRITIPTIFKYKNSYIWGSLSKASGIYRLMKF